MARIKSVIGREILDSRGNPTVEADVILDNGIVGRASVPSGASTGSREAVEMRDNDVTRYHGRGVLRAVDAVNTELGLSILGQIASEQERIDETLIQCDNSDNKSRLGANALLAVSLAVARAAAQAQDVPLYQYLSNDDEYLLPVPMMNIINGGAHADNNVDVQEFMIMPLGASSFSESLRYGAEVFHTLKSLLKERKLNTAVGDEGGFAPNLPANKAACDIILEAISIAGFTPGKDIYLALDVASSEFYQAGQYHLQSEGRQLSSSDMVSYLQSLIKEYPIISIEDGLAEDDWDGWQELSDSLRSQVQLVGDDLFVTNCHYLQQGIDKNIANAILIKPNQIGTLSETLQAIRLAQEANYKAVISHRSGETSDATIADLAVATKAGQIKTGSLCRSDRVAKYNQLLRVEEQLADRAKFAGMSALNFKNGLT